MPLFTYKRSLLKRLSLSRVKYRLIVRCFSLDFTALKTAKLVRVNRNTVNRYFILLRQKVISQALLERHRVQIANGVEIDESYFGPKRQKGKRGRRAGKKSIVLGLLKRDGRVY